MHFGKKYFAVPLIAAGVIALGISMFGRPRPFQPALPAILAGKDPDLVALVEKNLKAVSADPDDPDLWMRLGNVYEANGLDALGLDSYRKAVSIGPDQPKGWYRIGRTKMSLGDRNGALEALRRAVELEPDHAPLRWRLGFWQLDQGHLGQAQASFEQAIALNPEDPAGWWGLARVLLQTRRPEEAAGMLEVLAEKSPQDVYTHLLLGTAYRQLGRWEEARVELERGAGGVAELRDRWDEELEQYRTGYRVQAAKAGRLAELGELDAAMEILQKLQRRHPDNLAVLNNLGTVFIKKNLPQQALEVLGEALKRYPDNVHLHLNMATLYTAMKNSTLALEHLDRAIALDPRMGKAHEKKAAILMNMGSYSAAADACEQALRYDPRNPGLFLLSGLARCELEEWEKGLASFQRAVDLDSTFARGFVAIGEANKKLGKLGEAEDAFKRAASLNPRLKALLEDFQRLKAQGDE